MAKKNQGYILILILSVLFISLGILIGWLINSGMKIDAPSVATPSAVIVEERVEESCPDLLIRQGNRLLLINSTTPNTSPVVFNHLDDYIYYIKVQRSKNSKQCPVLYLQQEYNTQGEGVFRIRPGPFDPQGGLNCRTELSPEQTAFLSRYYPKNLGNLTPVPFQNAIAPSWQSTYQPPVQPESNLIPKHPPAVPYLDANHDNPPYNMGMFGFDPQGEYVGKYTVLDQIHNSTITQNPNGFSSNAMDPNWAGVQPSNQSVKPPPPVATVTGVAASLPNMSASYNAPSGPPIVPYTTNQVKTRESRDTTRHVANATTDNTVISPTVSSSTPSGSSVHKNTGDNPMDTNWGGVDYSRQVIAGGKYKENEVAIYVE